MTDPTVDWRDYVDTRLRDMDLRLQQRFDAQETSVQTALTAAEKAVNAALTAAEKAVEKSEAAQQRVNATQNEFRGTLSDQARDLMPRIETESLIRELRGLITENRNQMDAVRSRLDVGPPALSELQTRSDTERAIRGEENRLQGIRGFPPVIWVAVAFGGAGLIVSLINLLTK